MVHVLFFSFIHSAGVEGSQGSLSYPRPCGIGTFLHLFERVLFLDNAVDVPATGDVAKGVTL